MIIDGNWSDKLDIICSTLVVMEGVKLSDDDDDEEEGERRAPLHEHLTNIRIGVGRRFLVFLPLFLPFLEEYDDDVDLILLILVDCCVFY